MNITRDDILNQCKITHAAWETAREAYIADLYKPSLCRFDLLEACDHARNVYESWAIVLEEVDAGVDPTIAILQRKLSETDDAGWDHRRDIEIFDKQKKKPWKTKAFL